MVLETVGDRTLAGYDSGFLIEYRL
jgi:hypothetical protein